MDVTLHLSQLTFQINKCDMWPEPTQVCWFDPLFQHWTQTSACHWNVLFFVLLYIPTWTKLLMCVSQWGASFSFVPGDFAELLWTEWRRRSSNEHWQFGLFFHLGELSVTISCP